MMTLVKVGDVALSVDLSGASDALTEIEKRCNLQGTTPTQELLAAVADWLRSLGVPTPTPTQAWCVWWSVCEMLERLRRKYQTVAEVGHWLHVDASGMSTEQRLGLLENVERIKAQSQLHAGRFDPTDYTGVYNLVLLATGDEDQARRAQAIAAERYVDAKMGAKNAG